MLVFAYFKVLAVAILFSLAEATLSVSLSSITEDLGSRLSPNAQIILPQSESFKALTARWQVGHNPTFHVVVIVDNENDVSEAVQYANSRELPFLAYSGGHGTSTQLGAEQHGMEIWLRNLTKIEIALDGTSAKIGGGLRGYQLIYSLWAAGKQTPTGVCHCVGVTSPALGGGHGWLQGQYGLATDQIVSARLVLANGTIVTVSNSSHPDLYWALRGAGHNFGIVTEMTYRIYDATANPNWAHEIFIFSEDKLEAVYEILNDILPDQPNVVTHWGVWSRNVSIDPVNPVLTLKVIYNGPLEDCREHTKSIHALEPLDVQSGTTDYPGVANVTGYDYRQPKCQPSSTGVIGLFPADVDEYNITALRALYSTFREMMVQQPRLNGSIVLLEQYPVQAVRDVPAGSTAYPHRARRLLLAPETSYTYDPSFDAEAASWGERMRLILQDGSGMEPHSYVNYAFGGESLEAVYGYEPWRQERLRRLKDEYDPERRFGFYEVL